MEQEYDPSEEVKKAEQSMDRLQRGLTRERQDYIENPVYPEFGLTYSESALHLSPENSLEVRYRNGRTERIIGQQALDIIDKQLDIQRKEIEYVRLEIEKLSIMKSKIEREMPRKPQ
jgi:hypothetical protein